MAKQITAAPASLALGLVTATLADCLLSAGLETDAHTLLLWGLPCALGLALGSALSAVLLAPWVGQGRGRWLCAAFFVWFGCELAGVLWQAQELCWQHFSSLAVIGLAPGLVWLGWQVGQPALDHAARVLWWLVGVGALAALLGLAGQAQWQRLVAAQPLDAPLRLPLYAEYFALPLLCGQPLPRRAAALPLVSLGVQVSFVLAVQLVFGAQAGEYAGAELLRAMSLGVFSRLDALLVLIWLVTGLFRVCLLSHILRSLWAGLCTAAEKGAGLC